MPSVLLWRFYIFLHITFVLCISAPLNFPWMHKILRYSIIIRIYVNGNLFSVFILICCVITCIYVYILYILYMCIYIYIWLYVYMYIYICMRVFTFAQVHLRYRLYRNPFTIRDFTKTSARQHVAQRSQASN